MNSEPQTFNTGDLDGQDFEGSLFDELQKEAFGGRGSGVVYIWAWTNFERLSQAWKCLQVTPFLVTVIWSTCTRSPSTILSYAFQVHGLAWEVPKRRFFRVRSAERDLLIRPFSNRTFRTRPTVLIDLPCSLAMTTAIFSLPHVGFSRRMRNTRSWICSMNNRKGCNTEPDQSETPMHPHHRKLSPHRDS